MRQQVERQSVVASRVDARFEILQHFDFRADVAALVVAVPKAVSPFNSEIKTFKTKQNKTDWNFSEMDWNWKHANMTR